MPKKKVHLGFFIDIIKNSIKLIKKNKSLLWFGFCVAITQEILIQLINVLLNSKTQQKIIALKISPATHFIQMINKESAYSFLALAITFAIFITIIASLISSLLISIKQSIDHKKISIKKNLWKGLFFAKRLLALYSIIIFGLFIFVNIFELPIILASNAGHGQLAGVLSLAALFIVVPAIIISYFISTFSEIYLVIFNLSIKESLKNAYALLNKNTRTSILMLLFFCLFFLSIFIATLLIFYMLDVIIPFENTSLIYSIIFLVLTIIFKSVFSTLYRTAWFLFFREIASEKEIEKTEKKIIASEKKAIAAE